MTLDALFFSHFEVLGTWHDDLLAGETDPLPAPAGPHHLGAIDDKPLAARRARLAPRIDGDLYDHARFMSWVRYGHTREYRRYDTYTPTHLVGPYYESLLARHGYRLVHVNHASYLDLPRLARVYRPRYLMLSSTLTPFAPLADAVRRLHALWPGTPVVVGGLQLVEYGMNFPRDAFLYLLRQIDAEAYVVSSGGEEPLLEILAHDPGDLARLRPASTWIRHGDTYVKDESALERALPMDDAWVRWSTLNPAGLYHILHLRTAKGCPFRCKFCSFPVNQGPLTLASPETLEAELTEVAAVKTVRSVIFTDDTLNVPAARFRKICRVLSRFDLSWYCFFRVQYLTPDLAAMMRDAGCRGVFLGLESLDDHVLKNMDKHATRAGYARGIAALQQAGIPSHANFILGFPGDRKSNAAEIPRFCDDLGIEFFTAWPWWCSPATPIWKERAAHGLQGRFHAWSHRTMSSAEAFEAEVELLGAARRSVCLPELSTHSARTAFFLIDNGLSVGEAQEVLRFFAGLCGTSLSAAEVRAREGFARIREIILAKEFPPAVGASLGESTEGGAS